MSREKQTPAPIRSSAAEVLTYVASTGDPQGSIEIRYEDENIWLTQKTMAQLYDVSVKTINYHIKKIFDDSELSEDSVIRKFRITATDGKPYTVQHYALQMIIAVGFKVNSERAVQFRKWVNQIATQYTIRGWVMDDERLKRGTYLTDKYFEEQLERIREIRASERKFYQKITDLYATAIDYDRTSAATKRFYATVQNKMHFAVHGHTAAELIMERVDHTKDHMGLTTWQDAAEFLLLGASNLQVCTAIMRYGFEIVDDLKTGLANYMQEKGFASLNEMVGKCLSTFDEHENLDRKIKRVSSINPDTCIGCNSCYIACRDGGYNAITIGEARPTIDETKCRGCGVCQSVCPVDNCMLLKRV